MKLQETFCSLSLSRKLKQAGLKQETDFYWEVDDREINKNIVVGRESISQVFEYIATLSIGDLGEVLPEKIADLNSTEYPEYLFQYTKDSKEGHVCTYIYRGQIHTFILCRVVGDTEANARAEMVLRLLEMKCISIEDVNTLLTF